MPVVILLSFLLGLTCLCVAESHRCNSWEPVCGTDGNTYKNICELEFAKLLDIDLYLFYEGPCSLELSRIGEKDRPLLMKYSSKSYLSCTLKFMPVCGSDGRTYKNECFFKFYKTKNPSLTLTHRGWCKELQTN